MKVFEQRPKINISRFDGINYLEMIIRIVTGLFLILDGVHVLSHNAQLEEIFSRTLSLPLSKFLIVFIGTVHLFGGTFIVLGLLTRIVILIQVPAMLFEIYYIHPPNSFLGSGEIFASALLLIPLVFLFVKNSGKFSLDYFRMKKRQSKTLKE
jgi:uncharacterized membrane protein YphA (DoxX/SURF4 family)